MHAVSPTSGSARDTHAGWASQRCGEGSSCMTTTCFLKLQMSMYQISLTRQCAYGKHWNVIYEHLQSLVTGSATQSEFCLMRLLASQRWDWWLCCCYGAGRDPAAPPTSLRLCDQHCPTGGTPLPKISLQRVRLSCCTCQGSSRVPVWPWLCPCAGFYTWTLLSGALPKFPSVGPFFFSLLPPV